MSYTVGVDDDWDFKRAAGLDEVEGVHVKFRFWNLQEIRHAERGSVLYKIVESVEKTNKI